MTIDQDYINTIWTNVSLAIANLEAPDIRDPDDCERWVTQVTRELDVVLNPIASLWRIPPTMLSFTQLAEEFINAEIRHAGEVHNVSEDDLIPPSEK